LIKQDFTLYTTANSWGNSIISIIYKFLANPDGGFLAPSAVMKKTAVIDFKEIYLKISLTPLRTCCGGYTLYLLPFISKTRYRSLLCLHIRYSEPLFLPLGKGSFSTVTRFIKPITCPYACIGINFN
jgi:hypothetical protein